MRKFSGYLLISLFGFFILGHSVGELFHLSSHLLSKAAFVWHAHYAEAKRFVDGTPSGLRPQVFHRHDGQQPHIHDYHASHQNADNDTTGKQNALNPLPDKQTHTHHPLIEMLARDFNPQQSGAGSDLLLLLSFTNFINCLLSSASLPVRPDTSSGKKPVHSEEKLSSIYHVVPTPPPRLLTSCL